MKQTEKESKKISLAWESYANPIVDGQSAIEGNTLFLPSSCTGS